MKSFPLLALFNVRPSSVDAAFAVAAANEIMVGWCHHDVTNSNHTRSGSSEASDQARQRGRHLVCRIHAPSWLTATLLARNQRPTLRWFSTLDLQADRMLTANKHAMIAEAFEATRRNSARR
jgi:hypothetical protein